MFRPVLLSFTFWHAWQWLFFKAKALGSILLVTHGTSHFLPPMMCTDTVWRARRLVWLGMVINFGEGCWRESLAIRIIYVWCLTYAVVLLRSFVAISVMQSNGLTTGCRLVHLTVQRVFTPSLDRVRGIQGPAKVVSNNINPCWP